MRRVDISTLLFTPSGDLGQSVEAPTGDLCRLGHGRAPPGH